MKINVYELELRFTEPVLGTASANPNIYSDYIGSVRNPPLSQEHLEEELDTLPDDEGTSGQTVFHRQDGRPLIYDYVVRGFLKEAGNFLKDSVKVKNLRSKVDSAVFVFPRKILFEANGSPMVEGFLERPLRAQTQKGPRVALARSESLEGAMIRCTLAVLGPGEITENVLRELLAYGLVKGIGQWRGGSYGRFVCDAKGPEVLEGPEAIARLSALSKGPA